MKKDLSIIEIAGTEINFKINKTTGTVRGVEALAQKIIIRMLTLKGSNAFKNSLGTLFYQLFGTVDYQAVSDVRETIPVLLDDLVTQIKNDQILEQENGTVFEDNELLEDIVLEDVVFDKTFGGWLLTLKIKSKANEELILSIP
jgi:hypothetical protein